MQGSSTAPSQNKAYYVASSALCTAPTVIISSSRCCWHPQSCFWRQTRTTAGTLTGQSLRACCSQPRSTCLTGMFAGTAWRTARLSSLCGCTWWMERGKHGHWATSTCGRCRRGKSMWLAVAAERSCLLHFCTSCMPCMRGGGSAGPCAQPCAPLAGAATARIPSAHAAQDAGHIGWRIQLGSTRSHATSPARPGDGALCAARHCARSSPRHAHSARSCFWPRAPTRAATPCHACRRMFSCEGKTLPIFCL